MADKKSVKKKKKPNQVWKLYDKGKKKNAACPKCGPGVFLAKHKDRTSCGKCGYAEMAKKQG
jgi:ubiquitin-small subunit ribosomal protein S27Ae